MTHRVSTSLALLLVGAAFLVASALAAQSGEARKGGTLRLATIRDVEYVDTALAYDPFSWPIVFATCAKLFNHPDAEGAEGTKVIGEVVREYAVSTDRRTYTFELYRSFRFHTGAPVTAQSFAAAFNRDANPKQASPAIDFMREIVGAQDVIDGKATSISGVRVLGRYRLQIRLTKPLGDFLARLTLPFFCPILPATPIDPTGIDDPAGSGPYYVHERVVNQRVVLRRNPYYRGDRPANVDQVVLTIVPPGDCLLEVEQNVLDHCVAGGPPASAWRALAEKYRINRPGGQLFVRPALTTWFVAFNHDRPAFSGPGQIPLKKAISFAIDRHALVGTVSSNGYLAGKRTDQLLPSALARAASIYPLGGADLPAARRWYARARIKPTRLVLYVRSSPPAVAQSHVLTFNLRQLGIDLETKYFEAGTLVEKVETRGEPFDLAVDGWAADYADGGSFLETLLYGKNLGPTGSTGNLNRSYFDDPQTNARIEAAERLTGEARRKAWADLDVHLMRTNPPLAPFYHPNNRAFVSKSFGCFLFHPLYGVDIAAACKQ